MRFWTNTSGFNLQSVDDLKNILNEYNNFLAFYVFSNNISFAEINFNQLYLVEVQLMTQLVKL